MYSAYKSSNNFNIVMKLDKVIQKVKDFIISLKLSFKHKQQALNVFLCFMKLIKNVFLFLKNVFLFLKNVFLFLKNVFLFLKDKIFILTNQLKILYMFLYNFLLNYIKPHHIMWFDLVISYIKFFFFFFFTILGKIYRFCFDCVILFISVSIFSIVLGWILYLLFY